MTPKPATTGWYEYRDKDGFNGAVWVTIDARNGPLCTTTGQWVSDMPGQWSDVRAGRVEKLQSTKD